MSSINWRYLGITFVLVSGFLALMAQTDAGIRSSTGLIIALVILDLLICAWVAVVTRKIEIQ